MSPKEEVKKHANFAMLNFYCNLVANECQIVFL